MKRRLTSKERKNRLRAKSEQWPQPTNIRFSANADQLCCAPAHHHQCCGNHHRHYDHHQLQRSACACLETFLVGHKHNNAYMHMPRTAPQNNHPVGAISLRSQAADLKKKIETRAVIIHYFNTRSSHRKYDGLILASAANEKPNWGGKTAAATKEMVGGVCVSVCNSEFLCSTLVVLLISLSLSLSSTRSLTLSTRQE